MKRIILICIACMILLCGCSLNYVEIEKTNQKSTSMFAEIEATSRWIVVYHKETKVMYVVSYGSYNIGTFTLLVNADGTPMTYEGGD